MRGAAFAGVVASMFLVAAPATTGQAQTGTFEPTTASAEARSEFQKGTFQWRNAFAAKAATHLRRAVQLDPDFGFARILRGGVEPTLTPSERQQEYDRGLAALARAPAGELLLGLAWREQFSGRASISRHLFAAAEQLYPRDPEVARWASAPRRTGRPAAAVIAEVRRLIQQFPDHAIHHHNLGYALFNSGDRAGGIAAMREYARLEPNHPNSHESVAELLLRDGKSDEAIQMARRALAVDSSFVSAWANLADLRLSAGDLAGARAYWTRGLRLAYFSGDSVDYMHSLALSHLTEGDWKTAMSRLGEAAAMAESNRLTPRAALLHQQLALIDGLYGGGGSVSSHLAKATELGATNTAAQHVYSTLAHAGARHLDEARAAAGRFSAVATDANRRTQHVLKGFIALQADDPAAAITELSQANPNDILGRELLAEAQIKRGQRAEAQPLRDQVMKAATQVSGGRVLDLLIVIAKQRAKSMP